MANTGNVMLFKIVSESGIAAGVRRIEALTGNGVLAYYKNMEGLLRQAAKEVKASAEELPEKIRHLQNEIKQLQSENESLKSKMAKESLGDISSQVEEIQGRSVLAAKLENVDMNGLRELGDQLKEKVSQGVIILASAANGKVNLLVMAADEAVKAGAHAGNVVKAAAAVVGGGGGGRPNMAQAGGKNPAAIEDALKKAKEVLAEQLA